MSKTTRGEHCELCMQTIFKFLIGEQEETMSSQSLGSFQSFESYQARQTSDAKQAAESGQTLLSKVVFAGTVGIAFVSCAVAFLYPVFMHMFYFEY